MSNIIKTATHIVPQLPQPIRLQEYGVGIFNLIPTKSALKKALKKQSIKVEGVVATTATFINGGETITLHIDIEEKSILKKNLILQLEVLFEDEYLAAIHKPAGILVSGNKFKTIANALTQNLRQSNLSDATSPQPVHRLDYETTGILLVGKTSSSIRALNKMFENKEIEKNYFAVAIGKMDERGKIISQIDDKPSESEYIVIESVPSMRFEQLNLVKLQPLTGRRHQLRKHLLSIGNPILGDKKYGIEKLILMGKGLYLHAFSLSFIHPFTKEPIYIQDELPKRFNKLFAPK